MTHGQSTEETESTEGDWPDFPLSPTYNPDFLPSTVRLDPDEVVVHDPDGSDGGTDQWLSADRDSHVSLSDCR